MITTRRQILEYIRTNKAVTAGEIARHKHMVVTNARHHLSILVSQGLVQVLGYRSTGGRGRPSKIYGLSDQAVGDNLGGLADAFLSISLSRISQEEQTELFGELVNYMIKYITEQGDAYSLVGKGSLTQRLSSAILVMNEMDYQSHWEAHPETPRVKLGHCPYAVILPAHPELCRMDAVLLETLLDKPIKQLEKLVTDARGYKYCLFSVIGS